MESVNKGSNCFFRMHKPDLLNKKKSYILLLSKIIFELFAELDIFDIDKVLFVNPYTLL